MKKLTQPYLSWNSRNPSCAQILTSPSVPKVSKGFNASKMPLTQRLISRGL